MAGTHLSPKRALLPSCPGYPNPGGTTCLLQKLPPRSLLCHLDHFVLCAEGSGYPVFVFQVHVPLAVACACVRVCARTCVLTLSSCFSGQKVFVSGYCEPGMLSSVMCFLMLLWGPLLCFFVPKLLPLRQSGVSGSVRSLPVCTSLFPPSVRALAPPTGLSDFP